MVAMLPVFQCPTLELHTGDFGPPNPETHRHLERRREIVQILAVHHRVQRQGKADAGDVVGHVHLAIKAALVAADPVGHRRIDATQRKLDMVEPRRIQRIQPPFRQSDARRDEVGVKPRLARCRHQIE